MIWHDISTTLLRLKVEHKAKKEILICMENLRNPSHNKIHKEVSHVPEK